MLQGLLAERFGLKFHREMREMPVYVLVVGRSGPKFKESAPDAEEVRHVGVNGRNQNITLVQGTMENLADNIPNFQILYKIQTNAAGFNGTADTGWGDEFPS